MKSHHIKQLIKQTAFTLGGFYCLTSSLWLPSLPLIILQNKNIFSQFDWIKCISIFSITPLSGTALFNYCIFIRNSSALGQPDEMTIFAFRCKFIKWKSNLDQLTRKFVFLLLRNFIGFSFVIFVIIIFNFWKFKNFTIII